VEIPQENSFAQKMKLAADQLRRKIHFVRKNVRHLSKLHSALTDIAEPKNIFGVIVTNFCGGPMPGIEFPICDPAALTHYLAVGRAIVSAGSKAGQLVADDELTVPYYDSFATFRKNLSIYLDVCPPTSIVGSFLRVEQDILRFEPIGLPPMKRPVSEVVFPPDDEVLLSRFKAVSRHLRGVFG
jgi:hypothetical protein